MTKVEYIRQLEYSLGGKLSKSEISDILRDYSEYFEEGKREGKTEEEVSKNLGIPSAAASQILSEGREEPASEPPKTDVNHYWTRFKEKCRELTTPSEESASYGERSYPQTDSEVSETTATAQMGGEQPPAPSSAYEQSACDAAASAPHAPGGQPARETPPEQNQTPPNKPRQKEKRAKGDKNGYAHARKNDYQERAYSPERPYPERRRLSFSRVLLGLFSAIGMVVVALLLIPIGFALLCAAIAIAIGAAVALLGLVIAFFAIVFIGAWVLSVIGTAGVTLPASFILLFSVALLFCLAGCILAVCLVIYLFKGLIALVKACFGHRKVYSPTGDGQTARNPAYQAYQTSQVKREPAYEEYRPRSGEPEYQSPFEPPAPDREHESKAQTASPPCAQEPPAAPKLVLDPTPSDANQLDLSEAPKAPAVPDAQPHKTSEDSQALHDTQQDEEVREDA